MQAPGQPPSLAGPRSTPGRQACRTAMPSRPGPATPVGAAAQERHSRSLTFLTLYWHGTVPGPGPGPPGRVTGVAGNF
eukprot:766665-Hanusia_phi.AAC.10